MHSCTRPDARAARLGPLPLALLGTDIVVKLCLFLYCIRAARVSPIAGALAQDHRNDTMVNSVALACSVLCLLRPPARVCTRACALHVDRVTSLLCVAADRRHRCDGYLLMDTLHMDTKLPRYAQPVPVPLQRWHPPRASLPHAASVLRCERGRRTNPYADGHDGLARAAAPSNVLVL
jgi:hypothetical protein